MSIDPNLWTWPQWTLLIVLFLGSLYQASRHGKPRVDEKTQEPETYNGFVALFRLFFWIFLLAAGGFFGGAA